MRNLLSGLFSAIAFHGAASVLAHSASAPAFAPGSSAVSPPAPFAVVELFTSEGCSSCPPADRLLSELAAQAEKDGKPVFVLSFHVDYWNQLGWADPFSRPEFTRRQQRYAEAKDGRVYTPQMIVNGTDGFVGSRGGQARRSIAVALERSAGATISLTFDPAPPENPLGRSVGAPPTAPATTTAAAAAPAEGVASKGLGVGFRVTGGNAGDLMNLAVVEKGLAVPVKRGENGGRTLKHYNVVRAFRTLRLGPKGEGRVRMELPPEVKAEKAALVAYLQRAATLEILGAAKADLPKTE